MATQKDKLQAFLETKPNILIIINDQQRSPSSPEWENFEKEHLPNMQRLKNNGLTFNNSFTVACACSASRASMLTGTYPTQHGVKNTLPMVDEAYGGANPGGMPIYLNELRPTDPNLATMLNAADYHSYWKGKWHLMEPRNGGTTWTNEDIAYMLEAYGFDGWNPNDAGNSETDPQSFGDGFAKNDDRYVSGIRENEDGSPNADSILDFLDKYSIEEDSKPFFLVCSLVNPHDVWAAPTFLDTYGYNNRFIPDFGLGYPVDTANQDLSLQPKIQNFFKELELAVDIQGIENAEENGIVYNGTPLFNPEAFEKYVNFYAYLQTLADEQVGKILDRLQLRSLLDNTLIIRISDHGEMGVSHGLREKEFVAYDEAIKIPLIFSNPTVWNEAMETSAMVSNVDIAPTLTDMIGITNYYGSSFKGISLLPILELDNPSSYEGERTYIHYMTDDCTAENGAKSSNESTDESNLNVSLSDQDSIENTYGYPNFLRAIRSKEWMYCVTFLEIPWEVLSIDDYAVSPECFQYEMYDLTEDPEQMTNLAGDSNYESQQETLHNALIEEMRKNQTVPRGTLLPSDELETLIENGSEISNYVWPNTEQAIEGSSSYRNTALEGNN